ncbi:MAG: tRNA (adenosine(37)-N6)-dimethylallyltransferase MiaA [Actinomycetota bacterium]
MLKNNKDIKIEGQNLKKIKQKLLDGRYVLMLCGPTCTGKSRAAIELAGIFGTHLISVDSMQVYRGMDIGTDKVDSGDIKQYMVDLFEPDHYVTAVEFRDICRDIIQKEFFEKNRIPVLAGGSGLYIRAVLDKLDFAPGKNREIRKKIREGIKKDGLEKYFRKLEEVDPAYSKKIGSNDCRRIIRGLEVYQVSGKPYSSYRNSWEERESVYNTIFIGFCKDRAVLYKDIEERVGVMFDRGLVDEVKALIDKGYGQSYALKQAVGYKEVASYIRGEIGLKQCRELVKRNTRRLAKKQLTWFRADPRINWIRVDNYDNILSLNYKIIRIIGEKIGKRD